MITFIEAANRIQKDLFVHVINSERTYAEALKLDFMLLQPFFSLVPSFRRCITVYKMYRLAMSAYSV